MTRDQCEAHLSPGGMGRFVFVAARGPVALPVNYRYVDGHIVFRTGERTAITTAFGEKVGFEVDRIDEATSQGWSVLVTGRAARVEAMDRPPLIQLHIEPWVGGYRDVFVRVTVDEITGRSIQQSP